MLDSDHEIEYLGTKKFERPKILPRRRDPTRLIVNGIVLHVYPAAADPAYSVSFSSSIASSLHIGRRSIDGSVRHDAYFDSEQSSPLVPRVHNSDKILFKCPVVSRTHATIWFSADDGCVYLRDEDSYHGTYVRHASDLATKKLDHGINRQLVDGDILTFGRTVGHRPQDIVRPVVARVELVYGPQPPRTPTRPARLVQVPSSPSKSLESSSTKPLYLSSQSCKSPSAREYLTIEDDGDDVLDVTHRRSDSPPLKHCEPDKNDVEEFFDSAVPPSSFDDMEPGDSQFLDDYPEHQPSTSINWNAFLITPHDVSDDGGLEDMDIDDGDGASVRDGAVAVAKAATPSEDAEDSDSADDRDMNQTEDDELDDNDGNEPDKGSSTSQRSASVHSEDSAAADQCQDVAVAGASDHDVNDLSPPLMLNARSAASLSPLFPHSFLPGGFVPASSAFLLPSPSAHVAAPGLLEPSPARDEQPPPSTTPPNQLVDYADASNAPSTLHDAAQSPSNNQLPQARATNDSHPLFARATPIREAQPPSPSPSTPPSPSIPETGISEVPRLVDIEQRLKSLQTRLDDRDCAFSQLGHHLEDLATSTCEAHEMTVKRMDRVEESMHDQERQAVDHEQRLCEQKSTISVHATDLSEHEERVVALERRLAVVEDLERRVSGLEGRFRGMSDDNVGAFESRTFQKFSEVGDNIDSLAARIGSLESTRLSIAQGEPAPTTAPAPSEGDAVDTLRRDIDELRAMRQQVDALTRSMSDMESMRGTLEGLQRHMADIDALKVSFGGLFTPFFPFSAVSPDSRLSSDATMGGNDHLTGATSVSRKRKRADDAGDGKGDSDGNGYVRDNEAIPQSTVDSSHPGVQSQSQDTAHKRRRLAGQVALSLANTASAAVVGAIAAWSVLAFSEV
ncbi:hypothetical protein FISHEDRAFT_78739 [Fistulina hepatica ATCC 64428]|uniref:FHA domain-containing protein n=1 Tax=Fistulina hepatica ATCC 64428 TaxID=1128425 RepID=A0A0D7A2Q8_9AGAR|nr:hypothetical protein FISHEDRAFT_78739 [Fistulina hepatica ATCC 64428]